MQCSRRKSSPDVPGMAIARHATCCLALRDTGEVPPEYSLSRTPVQCETTARSLPVVVVEYPWNMAQRGPVQPSESSPSYARKDCLAIARIEVTRFRSDVGAACQCCCSLA